MEHNFSKYGDGYMIDTIRLRIMFDESCLSNYDTIKYQYEVVQKIQLGELVWEFTKGHLKGSWDNRISIQFREKDFFREPGTREPVLRNCTPFLIVELSLHKFFLGHNIFGMDCDLNRLDCVYDFLETNIGGKLNRDSALIERIDIAQCYKFESTKHVDDLFNHLYNFKRFRTPPIKYDGTVYWPSTNAITFKIYDKRIEFKGNDYKKLKKQDLDKANDLLNYAEGVVRLESEFKKDKLNSLFNKNRKVANIMNNIILLKEWHNKEKARVLYSSDDVKKLNHLEIHNLIERECPSSSAEVYKFYDLLVKYGDKFCRDSYKKTSYYKYKKIVKNLKLPVLGATGSENDILRIVNFNDEYLLKGVI